MKQITPLLWDILAAHVDEAAQKWLKSKESSTAMDTMTAFVAAPRQVSKKQVIPSPEQEALLKQTIKGFSVTGWSAVRLSRVWLLSLLDDSDRDSYIHQVRTLLDTAEMNELVALYSALPLLSYPEAWLAAATDAVRSNIGLVLDAIALQNPYPARYFGEAAWNQLVMKTIFNDKPIHLIEGLDGRANTELARILSDFGHERWAAGRQVAPEVWRVIVRFVSDATLSDLKHLLDSPKPGDRQAAALVCLQSGFSPALELLEYYPEMKELAMKGKLNWKNLEHTDLNTYVQ